MVEQLESLEAPGVPSPVCPLTMRVHAFSAFRDDEREVRCRDCGLVMPSAAVLRDGPGARHCLACGWWSPEADCESGAVACVWCKLAFDD